MNHCAVLLCLCMWEISFWNLGGLLVGGKSRFFLCVFFFLSFVLVPGFRRQEPWGQNGFSKSCLLDYLEIRKRAGQIRLLQGSAEVQGHRCDCLRMILLGEMKGSGQKEMSAQHIYLLCYVNLFLLPFQFLKILHMIRVYFLCARLQQCPSI